MSNDTMREMRLSGSLPDIEATLAESRAEVATLRKEREYQVDDLATFKERLAEKNREVERLEGLIALAAEEVIEALSVGIRALEAENAALKAEVELLRKVEPLARVIWHEWDQIYDGEHIITSAGDEAVSQLNERLAALDRFREEQK